MFTPCDLGVCPYEAEGGDACRFYFGLGCDEDSYPDEMYEDFDDTPEVIEPKLPPHTIIKCDRCSGSGIYKWGAIINGKPQHAGTCFKCNGSGKITANRIAGYYNKF